MRRIARILCTLVPFVATIATGPPAHAAFPSANGVIAFGSTTHGQSDIWIVGTGGGTTRLTDTPRRNESMPDWNAAGGRLGAGASAHLRAVRLLRRSAAGLSARRACAGGTTQPLGPMGSCAGPRRSR